MSLENLSSEERRQLLRFVCSFAWADLKVVDSERELLRNLVGRMGLPEAEAAEVDTMLNHPPDPATIDPTDVPKAHRQLFLDEVTRMVMADGIIADGEAVNLALFQALTA
jgi:hypothetical protein